MVCAAGAAAGLAGSPLAWGRLFRRAAFWPESGLLWQQPFGRSSFRGYLLAGSLQALYGYLLAELPLAGAALARAAFWRSCLLAGAAFWRPPFGGSSLLAGDGSWRLPSFSGSCLLAGSGFWRLPFSGSCLLAGAAFLAGEQPSLRLVFLQLPLMFSLINLQRAFPHGFCARK